MISTLEYFSDNVIADLHEALEARQVEKDPNQRCLQENSRHGEWHFKSSKHARCKTRQN